MNRSIIPVYKKKNKNPQITQSQIKILEFQTLTKFWGYQAATLKTHWWFEYGICFKFHKLPLSPVTYIFLRSILY